MRKEKKVPIRTKSKKVKWIGFSSELLYSLTSKTNHRLSRFDAFMWIVENVNPTGRQVRVGNVNLDEATLTTSYTRLADMWHWDRETVQKFINELTAVSAITAIKEGNFFIIRLNLPDSGRVLSKAVIKLKNDRSVSRTTRGAYT